MKVFVPGGAGYVGSVLVPMLLARDYEVIVYDLLLWKRINLHPNLKIVQGDVRDAVAMAHAMVGCEAVIHLACISNDPGCDLNPELARSINCDSFPLQVKVCKAEGIRLFIFASSASIYGVSDAEHVTEDHPRVPISDYNRYKAICEDVLEAEAGENFTYVSVRPGTVCGWSPRLRLDLTVNMLTAQSLSRGEIAVFGGAQYRPSIHINDLCRLYIWLLTEGPFTNHRALNAASQVLTIDDVANRIKDRLAAHKISVKINKTESNDPRSYRLDSRRLLKTGFKPLLTIDYAIEQLVSAWAFKRIKEPIDGARYVNIHRYKEVGLE